MTKTWTTLALALLLTLPFATPLVAGEAPAAPRLESPTACPEETVDVALQQPFLGQSDFVEVLAQATKPEQEPQGWGECSVTCPGSPLLGILPYTMSCGSGQTCGGVVLDSNGQQCGIRCNGSVMICFPNGCF